MCVVMGEKAVWEVIRMWTDGIKRHVSLRLVIFDRKVSLFKI